MGLLPEIVDGQLQEDGFEQQIRKFNKNFIPLEKKKKLAEQLAKIKAKHLERDLMKVDEDMAALNNMGRNLVTEDFSDSPFADRAAPKEKECPNCLRTFKREGQETIVWERMKFCSTMCRREYYKNNKTPNDD